MLHGEKNQIYSFPTVMLAIEARLSQLIEMGLNHTQEAELLVQLEKKIHAFEHIQKRWLSGSGILANYYKADLLETISEHEDKFKTINQDELVEESIKSIKEGAEFAIIMAQQIILFINDENNQRLLDPTLFKKIEKGLQIAKDAAKRTYHIASNLSAQKISSKPIFKFAQLLGGRFIFSSQEIDPIHGTDKFGLCYGYVMDWRDEVSHSGKYLSLSRSDRSTVIQQSQQQDESFLQIPCQSTREIWKAIDDILLILDTTTIYDLSYYSKQGAHAMGLRKCPNGEIEFFDPNHGLFVFPDTATFRIWFNELLSDYLRFKDDISIRLANIGKQAHGSVPTIPALSQNKEDRNEHITHHYNFNYLYEKKSLTNLKKCIKEINHINKIEIDLNEVNIYPSYDNAFVKKKIIAEITFEIERLKSNLLGDNQKKIMALKELSLRITNNNPSLTLIGTIESWLQATPLNSTETYGSIIKSQRIFGSGKPTSASFIDHLITRYETNEPCMAAMQTSVLNHILSIIYTFKVMNREYSSPLFQAVSDACAKNNVNTQNLIQIIKQSCVAQAGLFAQSTQDTNEKILKLYKLIKDLNPDDPVSLTLISNSLRDLFKSVKKDFDMKVSATKKKRGLE